MLERNIRQIRYILLFFAVVLGVYLMKVLSALLIPLALAFFLALLLYPVIKWLVQVRIPYFLSVVVVMGLLYFVSEFILERIIDSFETIANDSEMLTNLFKVKVEPVANLIKQYLGVDIFKSSEMILPMVAKYISPDIFFEASSTLFLTLLYLIFILTGNILETEKHLNIILGGEGESKWVNAYKEIRGSITKYMLIKGGVSLLTGASYTIACLIFGVPYAYLWGFLAFLLNFIPNFGSLIATFPPFVLGWLMIDSSTMLLVYGVVLIVIQQVMGNIVEPYWMGKSFSINTIVVLFGLVLCTYIWGIVGAVLSVPILVLLKVVLHQMPSTGMLERLIESH